MLYRNHSTEITRHAPNSSMKIIRALRINFAVLMSKALQDNLSSGYPRLCDTSPRFVQHGYLIDYYQQYNQGGTDLLINNNSNNTTTTHANNNQQSPRKERTKDNQCAIQQTQSKQQTDKTNLKQLPMTVPLPHGRIAPRDNPNPNLAEAIAWGHVKLRPLGVQHANAWVSRLGSDSVQTSARLPNRTFKRPIAIINPR